MNGLTAVAIAALGGTGAVARSVLDGAITRRSAVAFPVGIFVVNVSGAFALGVLTGAGVGGDVLRLAGAGLLGAFTTFSTWMFQADRLHSHGQTRLAGITIAASLAAGLIAVWLGRECGSWF